MTIGAFSIILDKGNRVLLCKRRDKDLWNLPGGRVEQGESPWNEAIREAREEINVDISIEKLVEVYFKQKQEEIVFQFLARIEKKGLLQKVKNQKKLLISMRVLYQKIQHRDRRRESSSFLKIRM